MSKAVFSSDFTLGILGGGQLGKMMLYHTRKYDIRTKVMDPNPHAPARLACDEFVVGDIQDAGAVAAFGQDCDLVTLEIEAVSLEGLFRLRQRNIKVYPDDDTLELIVNKSRQKDFYVQHDMPTSAHTNYMDRQSIPTDLHYPVVWKAATGGYDGNGVQILKSDEDRNALPDIPCLIEEAVDIGLELAVIVARSSNGEIKTYPVVEMEFHPTANQVEYVICPARIPDRIAETARAIALDVSDKMKHVGLLAVELFLTKEGKLLINEVAPRPHNSGHYSIEGSFTDQFDQHIRAILGLPLGATSSKVPAVMVNLVGAQDHTGPVRYEGLEDAMQLRGVIPHIYGKKETRPFRKMGHVTIIDEDIDEARHTASKVKKMVRVVSR